MVNGESQKGIDILQGTDVRVETVVQRIRARFHEATHEVFDTSIDKITEWVRRRFEALKINVSAGNTIELRLNPYNEGETPLGIQSVSVGFRKANGEKLRLENHWKDSTIGVIAPDLIESDEPLVWSTVGFPVEKGKREVIYGLSRKLALDSCLAQNLIDEEPSQVPQSAESPGVIVTGPDCARTILQRKKSQAKDDLGNDRKYSGVYACDYEIVQEDESVAESVESAVESAVDPRAKSAAEPAAEAAA